jgi:hypothetical protein
VSELDARLRDEIDDQVAEAFDAYSPNEDRGGRGGRGRWW